MRFLLKTQPYLKGELLSHIQYPLDAKRNSHGNLLNPNLFYSDNSLDHA